jgi:hypothetical protein
MSPASGSIRSRLEAWLHDRPDDTVLRWLFATMLSITITVLALDYVELSGKAGAKAAPVPGISNVPSEPLPARRGGDGAPVKSDAKLKGAMTFDLVGDGRLMAVGTIAPGTADVFAAEVTKRGSYIKTIVLESPGGSVSDALEMGRLIRAKKLATEIDSGRYCASSCPLVFAGGVERRAGEKAAIGVHQAFALARSGGATAANGMEDAQRVSAECQRYLRDMGVDLQVWVHAMETPKDQLYYFKADELLTLKLATQAGKQADLRARL